MKLIVGLGNPGKEYENTRHNVGFLAVDKIAKNESFSSWKLEKKFRAEISQGEIVTAKVSLAKPQTFMNNSGEAVLVISQYYKIPPKDIIVIHDDLDLLCAKLRICQNSSSGGHRGVQSIIDHLHSQDFVRFKIGISYDTKDQAAAEKYVLEKFNSEESARIDDAISLLIEAIEYALSMGVTEAMNEFN